MTLATDTSPPLTPPTPEKAAALALRLAQAETELSAFASGQVDAIVAPSGRTYLLHGAQEHLLKNEGRLQDLLESAADLITVLNRAGVIVSQSRAAIRLLGYDPERLIGRNIFDLVHPDDLGQLHAAFFNVIEGLRRDAIVDLRLNTHNGEPRLLEATVSKLHDSVEPCVVMICRDVASREPARQTALLREVMLAEASKAKDLFIAILSHELRAPLAPALLGLEVLAGDERFVEAQPILSMIRQNLKLQSHLLEELLDFTTLHQHKVRLRLAPVNVHEVVRAAIDLCQSEIRAATVDVRLDDRAVSPMAIADAVRLQQVIWNLLKNAIKFSPPGSSVIIASANETPAEVTLDFIDHGIGIEPAFLPNIFHPFEQGEPAPATGSLGLGLFIAKGLAEAQHGEITVASEGRGRGATFRLKLKTAPTARPLSHFPPPLLQSKLPL